MKAVIGIGAVGASLAGGAHLLRRGTTWGSTPAERVMRMPGDTYLEGGPAARTVMTRAISIAAPPDVVWPWLAQMGRGAGWYSYERLDNGGKTSARHIVSWIPPPHIGDATAVGWLRDLEPGRSLTWWLPGQVMASTVMRMVVDIRLGPEGPRSRLVIRISGDATGTVGRIVVGTFGAVDSIMAIRQLKSIKWRAETFGTRATDPARPATGDRAQFQRYETIWASGDRAGIAGRERAELWRADAAAAGVLNG
jgi:hypothetical protein